MILICASCHHEHYHQKHADFGIFSFYCRSCGRTNEGDLDDLAIMEAYGAEYVLSVILSEEIRREIDREVLDQLCKINPSSFCSEIPTQVPVMTTRIF